MTPKDRVMKFLAARPNSSQKEISDGTAMHLSGVSRICRSLYESGQVIVHSQPGMSMRYTLKGNPDLLRTPKGDPLYQLFDPAFENNDVPRYLNEFAVAATTNLFKKEGAARKEYQEVTKSVIIPALKRLILLSEVLANASDDQVKTTIEEFEKENERRNS